MAFEVQKSVGLFKNSQENQSTINTHRSGARTIKSILPSAIAQSKENIE